MRAESRGERAFAVEFEDEAELRAEERAHLAVGGLLVPTAVALAADTPVTLTLRLAGGPPIAAAARVVAALPGGLALHLDGDPAALVASLLASPGAADAEPEGSLWERLRKLTPPQKMLLAPKADRVERALLVQESDPQVLFALLKNPRLTLDEVVRVAKSSFLSFQAAELILKTPPWFANLDIRVAMIHNPKLPLPFALRILPTLPDNEARAIAKGAATSMALKQAALKRIQGG
jgi:hypothetical protein